MTAKAIVRYCFLLLIVYFTTISSGKAQLVANFSGTPTSGCVPLVVNFTDLSTGSPNQWRWDLGNGTISFIQNPSGTYFLPGQYTIKLIIQNAAGTQDSITKNQYINVYGLPTIDFTAAPTSGCYPLAVQFTDASTAGSGTITSWLWDFGDGNTGTTQNPAHTYTSSGNFNVTLQVTNSFGCSKTITKSQFIQVSTGVTASFTNTSPTSCTAPTVINFTNTSSGVGTLSYQWFFGDGGSSTLQNPSHAYLTNGSYNVTLIVTSTTGCTDTVVVTNGVVINTIVPIIASADSVCLGSPLSFVNASTPIPTSTFWRFGDGTTSTNDNPIKTYAATGNYVVKMLSTTNACTDSVTKTITVLPKPQAAFTAPITTSCSPPLTVNFSNLSTGATSYFWDFGDGNTSSATNPTHTYTNYGSYNVILVATSIYGCVDSLRLPDFVKIKAPVATISNIPVKGCAPLTHTFAASVNSLDPVISYFWDLGDGTTSILPNPTNIYNQGAYTIKLTITTAGGCIDTVEVIDGILAGNKPTANFTATPRNACAREEIEFTSLSLGNVTDYLWYFGDGNRSTDPNPMHHYTDTGFFSVKLIIWNNGCPDSIEFNNYVYIKPPIANFNTSFTCGAAKTITFTDNSIGADQWEWNFGDGGTSFIQSPVHTYADTGTYTIMLRVVNFVTGCDDTATRTIRLYNQPANFNATDTTICRNTSTTFSAFGNTPGTVAYWAWSFGDGGTSTGETVSHTYTNPGYYTVKLVITDIAGCKDSLIKTNYIRVDGPTASYVVNNGGACLNSPALFNDLSISDGLHPIAKWIWNFGDGTIDTLTAPPFVHTYTTIGAYIVLLTVIDSEGCFDISGNSTSIILSDPVANFNTVDTVACRNQLIQFSNTSVGPSLTFFWTFGDGSTSSLSDPIHSYTTDGNYTVKLFITDQYGCVDSIIKNNYILISTPHASFTISDSISTCPPLIVHFTSTSTNGINTIWDFGDGSSATGTNPTHFYNNPGIYRIKLAVTGLAGTCSDTAYRTIIIRGPRGTFSYNPLIGCKPHTINIAATTLDRLSFIWDFNDGNTLNTTDSIISHTYTIPGYYVPKMILVDSGGCQVPIQGADTVYVNGVNALFGYNGLPHCDTGTIQFTDSSFSNEVVTNYNWQFGDGGISSLQHPSHFYANVGQYFPQLIITTASGCKDTTTLPVPVKIVATPNSDFTNSPNDCAPVSILFNGFLNVPDTSIINWNWSFGNGNTSTLQNPPAQLYTTAQVYNIRMIATNSTGCKDTVNKTVEAYLVPTVTASADVQICRFTNTPLIAAGATSYSWSPALGLSCTNCFNPIATPDSSRKYVVTGSTIHGCSNTDTVAVTVIQPFIMQNDPGDTVCIGGTTRLFAIGANTYLWSPAAGLNSTTSPTPIARPTVTTTYRVIGFDAYGCFTDTGFATVNVFPIPTVNAGNDVTINNGQTTVLSPTISSDVSSIYWIPTNSIVATNYPAITVKPKQTTEYTIEVRNNGGCKSSDKVTVFVICDGTNVFIPNTFSPNGDGVNDLFYPRGTGLFNIKTMRIFDRWGEIVFEKNNYLPNDINAAWDGTYKGRKLTSDVYVYTTEIICENSTTLVLKGNIALVR